MFCNGVSPYGSYWDHVLGYLKASIETPDKVCLVKFEEMKKQPVLVLKKIAGFIGCPFSCEEEQDGVVQKIVDFCSFESLTSFEVNSSSVPRTTIPGVNNRNNVFFRKGQTGDYKNYLTDDMILRLTLIAKIKFAVGKMDEEMEPIISSLTKQKGWLLETIYKYEGFWFEKPLLYGSLIVQRSFVPKPEDVILGTLPKVGTTWFCALLFTTINRTRYDFSTHPLLTINSHDLVPHAEFKSLKNPSNPNINSSSKLLLGTHMPYMMLPKSVGDSGCKIVYVCRNPMDDFVSLFHYANKVRPQELPPLELEEAFDMFCNGVSLYGSYWDHVLGCLKASIETPDKVCLVKFEDMKKQPILVLKKNAQFVGCPFSSQEEENGVVQKIVDFCSFESLTSLEVNSSSVPRTTIPGQTGDYKNYLTDEMILRLTEIVTIKFAGT
ncbi:Cytosolic sulfotransferase 17, partial [Bienertia sinuspersici]